MKRIIFLACIFFSTPAWSADVKIDVQATIGSTPNQNITEISANNGISAWLVEDHQLPIINLRLLVRGSGSAYDANDQQGLSLMASGLLKEGAGDLNSAAFHSALDTKAINLEIAADNDNLQFALTTLSEHKDAALHLLGLAINQPQFAESAIEQVRKEILTAQKLALENPQAIAQKRLLEIVWPNHPYGRDAQGNEQSINNIKIADLKNWATSRLVRSRMQIVVTGDISAAELKDLLDKNFTNLPLGTHAEKLPPAKFNELSEKIHLIFPTPQTIVFFALPGITRDDERFYAAQLLNQIMGGGSLTSRLGSAIREKRGLSYYVWSALAPAAAGGIIIGSFASRNDMAALAISTLKAEISKAEKGDFTEQELDNAKKYLMGRFPIGLASNKDLADILMQIRKDNLGKEHISKRNELLKAVTLQQVNQLAQQLLKEKKLLLVSIGKDK